MIYLIRHGETASNAARIVQMPDEPLSGRGIRQAERLAARLAAAGIGTILCSDLRRAVMTAEPLHAVTGAAVSLDAGLQERNYGDIRGHSYASLGVDILASDYEPPGGEAWEVFYARVETTWRRVSLRILNTRGAVAIVTHGLVCFALARRHLRLPPGVQVPVRWGNTAVTVIDALPPWQVRLLNCTAHLDDAAADDPAAGSGF
jgi:broad specificity phosphatase PhoE